MRLVIEKCGQSSNVEFFAHRYRINSFAVSRAERISIRKRNQSLSSTSILSWCGYADDLVLFLQSKSSLQNATVILDNVFTKFGLSVNVQKTETMILNFPSDSPYPNSSIELMVFGESAKRS